MVLALIANTIYKNSIRRYHSSREDFMNLKINFESDAKGNRKSTFAGSN